jgi:hypothetical protein
MFLISVAQKLYIGYIAKPVNVLSRVRDSVSLRYQTYHNCNHSEGGRIVLSMKIY